LIGQVDVLRKAAVVPERRYRAVVGYDGTDFLGYQLQAQGRTVQGEIEKTLKKVTQVDIRIDGAGRTDAGVHATGQVIAFNASWKHSLEDFQRALNALLPADIVISDLQLVEITFQPRFQAVSRTYQYTIINQPWPSVLERRYTYHVRNPLDVAAMRQASQFLVGAHDFASFGKPPQGENTVRQVMSADWFTAGTRLIFEITANAFLYRMVRTIVGTLVQVGLGQLAPLEIKDILAASDLTQSAPPAPAHGLCLVRVSYPKNR
jgi:tRNA pseudouridine38-40 synthase